MKTLISDYLLEHAAKKTISFHMPGHKGSAFYRRFGHVKFLENIMDCDVTEIPGTDNLFEACGIIKETQVRYARLYGAKQSYLLINGTSVGIISAILASVRRAGKIIAAENSHKSVFNALTLADIKPVYAYPDAIADFGITGAIPPGQIDRLLAENPDAEAVIIPSPNYYGICSDISEIAKAAHKYGKVLIVDEAHGAHLTFFNNLGINGLPRSAGNSGADIVINSIHKTLGSFTQSSVLNVFSDRVSQPLLEDKLQCLQSTSPSYILMASLGINASIIEEHGRQVFAEWDEALTFFYENAKSIKGLSLIGKTDGMDWTKLNFGFGSIGIKGGELEELLRKKYGIITELFYGDFVLGMTGVGSTRKDIEALLNALAGISAGTA